jgi:hypothetical protein
MQQQQKLRRMKMDKKKALNILKKIGNGLLASVTICFVGLIALGLISKKFVPVEKMTATVTNVDRNKVTTDKGVFYYNTEMKDAFNLTANKKYNIVTQKTLFGYLGSSLDYAAPVCN